MEKVSKMQERGDADVGEIEYSGEEQECRKKTKKGKRGKDWRNRNWTWNETWEHGNVFK